jgi:hypothetical protein
MATYTVILDYRGGTYISQVAAGNARLALVKWAKQIKPHEIQHLGPKRQAKLISDIESNIADLYTPTPIREVVNVWCTGFPLPGGLVNIIRTET